MKHLKKLFLIAIVLILPTMLFGQYAEDILRTSNLFYKGTARFTGMSGAFGALGGDFTTLSINPAGIGTYNKAEFVFTPALYNTKSVSNFFGTEREEHRTHFNFNNVGMIIPFKMMSQSGVKAVHFGIGFNRTQDFYNRSYMDGFNDKSSFLTGLAGEANRYGVDVFDPIYPEDLAASTLLIFPDSTNMWTNDMPNGNVQQSLFMETRGAINEMVMSFGGNVNDKLYFGITMGFPFYYYKRNVEYSETDVQGLNNTTNPFQSMRYTERLTTNGTGINGKFGLIYKPLDMLRFGVAIHTPTYYWNMRESWDYSMEANYKYDIEDPYGEGSVNHVTDATPIGYNNYEITSAMRIIASAAVTIGKYGLLDVDYEWADQKSNRMSPASTYKDVNDEIRNSLKSQHIVRAGTEWKIQNFFLRGGYAWYGSPYKSEINDASIHSWSLGCGVRIQNFGLDFAYQHLLSKSDYYLYNFGDVHAASSMTNKANSYVLTLSFRY